MFYLFIYKFHCIFLSFSNKSKIKKYFLSYLGFIYISVMTTLGAFNMVMYMAMLMCLVLAE